jgi:hypothetical protein
LFGRNQKGSHPRILCNLMHRDRPVLDNWKVEPLGAAPHHDLLQTRYCQRRRRVVAAYPSLCYAIIGFAIPDRELRNPFIF